LAVGVPRDSRARGRARPGCPPPHRDNCWEGDNSWRQKNTRSVKSMDHSTDCQSGDRPCVWPSRCFPLPTPDPLWGAPAQKGVPSLEKKIECRLVCGSLLWYCHPPGDMGALDDKEAPPLFLGEPYLPYVSDGKCHISVGCILFGMSWHSNFLGGCCPSHNERIICPASWGQSLTSPPPPLWEVVRRVCTTKVVNPSPKLSAGPVQPEVSSAFPCKCPLGKLSEKL